jgi:hypothetical protein
MTKSAVFSSSLPVALVALAALRRAGGRRARRFFGAQRVKWFLSTVLIMLVGLGCAQYPRNIPFGLAVG